ncbi:CsgE family curli-type amyloid fiber assembly protein [Halomonas marinisediminis]|uniref:Curli production assembly/transport component CsgE n=1 Tax=Halomonas marinisediminis TaxID=2546095 RepID=A0ABY2DC18_9GAMM|nr:CsgE family curli-type amyloid fiber assembly protein [Halomonas marinisediminis]TDB02884.1 hypothetical protein E0702_07625 [Halomonas marinisediminis]
MRQRLASVVSSSLASLVTLLMLVAVSSHAQVSLDSGGAAQGQASRGQDSIAEQEEGVAETPGQAEEELEQQFQLGEPGIAGVLIDRTITMTGKTFFRQFSQLSLARPIISEANLAVYERPSARWGSQVWITLDNQVVFEATMPPRLSDVDDYVEVAIEQVEQRVIRKSILQALDNDPDLADEEI